MAALGAVRILDGLEITVATAVAETRDPRPETLQLSATQVGLLATVHLLGIATPLNAVGRGGATRAEGAGSPRPPRNL